MRPAAWSRSWLNPTSVTIGILAVTAAAYTAAVFLSADAAPARRTRSRRAVPGARARRRPRGRGRRGRRAWSCCTSTRTPLRRLVHGPGLAALVVSLAAGVATLALVWRRRYEPARYTSALAVAATIAGWALAQQPLFLPGLTIKQAAAPHDTQVAVVVAVLAGAVILFPSLALLFRLTLGGRLAHGEGEAPRVAPSRGELDRRHALHSPL